MKDDKMNEILDEEETRYLREIEELFAQPDTSKTARNNNEGSDVDMNDYCNRVCERMSLGE